MVEEPSQWGTGRAEVAGHANAWYVRDSENPEARLLRIDAAEWTASPTIVRDCLHPGR